MNRACRMGAALLASGIAALLLAGCSGKAPGGDADDPSALLERASVESPQWVTTGGTYDEQRYSALDQITKANVGTLGLAWFADLDTNRGQEATPLVVDGTIFVTTAWSRARAYDAGTGKLMWSYDPQVPGRAGYSACCDVVNRGGAYFDGMFYLGTIDGRLIALDARTGKVRWSVVTVDQGKPYTITGAPRVIKGRVVIGNGGAEYGVRGYVTAYDARSGKLAWRFYTVPDAQGRKDGAASDPVWQGEYARTWADGVWKQTGGGGTVWDAIVYDRKYDRIYLGVGNGTPWDYKLRSGGEGDNLFLSSIVALDAATGAYAWHYQTTPAESWDFTATQPIMLATLKIDGKPRDVLMQAPKNGFFYVIDRATGKLVSARNYVPTTWASGVDMKTGRPIETELARRPGDTVLRPGPLGGHGWHPMAFSPQTGLVYIPAQDLSFEYRQDRNFALRPGQYNAGFDFNFGDLPAGPAGLKAMKAAMKGRLLAWDPVAQRAAWGLDGAAGDGGVLATGGGLLFQGTVDGAFRAVSASDGKVLWRFAAQDSVMAGPVTYRIGKTQYVAVMAGQGGSINVSLANRVLQRPANGRLLVFKLGGDKALPPLPRVAIAPANPAREAFLPAQVERGRVKFAANCGVCHGSSAVSSGVLPDLRRSAALADKRMWDGIVLDGALEADGMISFRRFLGPGDVEDIRSYVSLRAGELKAAESGPAQ